MGYPYAPPQYVPVAPKPGGGTAITAGVLTLLQGLGLTAFSIFGAVETRHDRLDGSDTGGDMAALIIFGALSALVLSGAILLLCRRTAGRVIVIGLSGLILLGVAVVGILGAALGDVDGGAVEGFAVASAVVLVVELPILVCAVSSSTGRWIAARKAPVAHYPYY